MKLFIYGASGAGKEVCDLVRRNEGIMCKYSEVCLLDDFQPEVEFYGTRRLQFASCAHYSGQEQVEFAIAIGEPSIRKILYEKVTGAGYRLATLIDKTATISDTARIESGCIIQAGAFISSNVTLHQNCMVMFGAIIGHDAEVQSHCVICPKSSIGGHTHVGEQSFVGIGSSVMQEVNIGCHAIVGMGSMVFREVADRQTVVGNPAKVTRGNDSHKVFG